MRLSLLSLHAIAIAAASFVALLAAPALAPAAEAATAVAGTSTATSTDSTSAATVAEAAEPSPGAAAPMSTGARAPMAVDQGWNDSWALLFQVSNVLASSDILGNFNGGIGAAKPLSPDMMVRLSLAFGRSSAPSQVTKTTVDNGPESTTDYARVNAGTSSSDLTLRADFVYRLLPTAVAPYGGAGLFAQYGTAGTSYTDDMTVRDQTTTVNNKTTTFGFGLRGVLGAEWRLHPSFALFAEYQAALNVVSYERVRGETVTENTADGTRSVLRTRSERDTPRWLNMSSGIVHTGQLGLAVMF